MCLAVPSKIINIDDLSATVDVFGARREISLLLLPEEAGVGDYVLVHAGFAIQKIDEAVALDSMRLIREYAEALEEYEDSMPEQPRSIFGA
ncbi:MAG TPA: HypC/HybG/HupF family hydrogenase formation chaperone [Dissulfurispiraceae bacterium]|nr:HypC/HybG/HupF family hydrogenase formation chaperone [Dissulfurispiraceae bacterium]